MTSGKSFVLYDPMGARFADKLSAEGFCTGLRQLIEAVTEPAEVQALADRNQSTIERLRTDVPALKTAKKVHYADILERLIKDRLAPAPASTNGTGHDVHAPTDVASPSLPPTRPSRIGAGP
ncbi:MAG TPA: hypothetical protein VFP10_04285, partial [Candidatus Eisenbacteria bacterium]|nr:hypothetical protein [Candidatus Eisenbacteria bacterium]